MEPRSFGKEIRDKEYMLSPNAVFLNHGSYGVVPKRIFQHQMTIREKMESHPDDFYRRKHPALYRQSLEALCGFIGAKLENTVLVENATTALDSVIKSLQLKSEDTVLITSLSYHSVVIMTKNLKTQFEGPDVCVLQLEFPMRSKDEIVKVYDEFLSTHSNIRLAILDHITSPSSILMPVKEISQLLHRHNILTLVDGAHACGQVALRIEDLDVDFYAGNVHKWFFTPRGCGFLWIHPKHHGVIRPAVVSHFHGMKLHYDFCVRGTRDDTPYHTIPAAVAFMEELGGLAAITNYIGGLLEDATTRLEKAWQTKRLDLAPELQAPFMKLIQVPDMENYSKSSVGAGELETDLFVLFNIQVICMLVQGHFYFRLSAHVYNCMDDFIKLEEAVLQVMAFPRKEKADKGYQLPIMHWDLSPLTDIHADD